VGARHELLLPLEVFGFSLTVAHERERQAAVRIRETDLTPGARVAKGP
jgi:hypothetical protein